MERRNKWNQKAADELEAARTALIEKKRNLRERKATLQNELHELGNDPTRYDEIMEELRIINSQLAVLT